MMAMNLDDGDQNVGLQKKFKSSREAQCTLQILDNFPKFSITVFEKSFDFVQDTYIITISVPMHMLPMCCELGLI